MSKRYWVWETKIKDQLKQDYWCKLIARYWLICNQISLLSWANSLLSNKLAWNQWCWTCFSVVCILHSCNNWEKAGSGCGTVDSTVASDTRGPGFESSHRQLLLFNLFTVSRKHENKEKEAGNGPLQNQTIEKRPVLNSNVYFLQNNN